MVFASVEDQGSSPEVGWLASKNADAGKNAERANDADGGKDAERLLAPGRDPRRPERPRLADRQVRRQTAQRVAIPYNSCRNPSQSPCAACNRRWRVVEFKRAAPNLSAVVGLIE